MAIFQLPFMYRLSKSMADNTYYYARGNNVVRVKVNTNTSNTLKQQQQRAKMGKLFELSDVFFEVLSIGFPKRPVEQTPANAFVQANKDVVSVTEELAVSVDLGQLVVSKGKLRAPEEMTVVADQEGHMLTFSYAVEDFGRHASRTDVLYAVVLETEKMRARLYRLGTNESLDGAQMTVPAGWDMAALEVYAFAVAENGRDASDSVNLAVE